MTPEDFKTIAAFGGFALGLINLFITIYKEFLRKGKLQILIENAIIKYDGGGTHIFRFDLVMNATGGDVFLKDMYICHKIIRELDLTGDKTNKVPILKLANYVREDILTLDFGELYFKGKDMLETASDVRGFKISDKSQVSTTVVEYWNTPPLDNDWARLPLAGWSILAKYNNTFVETPFIYKQHPESKP